MHQPQYVDPRTGRAELPWVRLHGARAYLDVARLLEEYPHVKLTVNFVPSLTAQLEAIGAGRARDAWLEVAEKPTADLTPPERELLVTRFFSLNWGRGIDPRPRYRELLDKRGRSASAEELRQRAAQFSDGELRDLTVLFYLSWLGFAAREGHRELEALERKGRGFDRDDFQLVVERQQAACASVLPAWRALADRGQVELSASPFYHPIVPLLLDSDVARRARPDLQLPARYSAPDDARAQIERGAESHRRVFGERPRGMWPPEGSISPEAVAAYHAAGVGWLASDEGNLWRSFELAGRAQVPRGELYRAYRHGGVDLVFRDREASDRIGFSYAHGDPGEGAADLLRRAREAAERSTAPASDPALVPLFLDGENPWEAYPDSGQPFLRALFAGLAPGGAVESASIAQHLAEARERVELPSLHSGSWIDSDFHIWIGDPIKNRAWELLGKVRRRFERALADGTAPDRVEAAHEALLAAEGSDWFWWFGEPFHSAEDALFDRLFRAHLQGVLAALGDPIPEELERPVAPSHGARGSEGLRAPYAFIRPRIDAGHAPSFYEWHGAGRYDVPRGAAMADTPMIERIHFGFDPATLYLRLDAAPARAAELDGATLEIEIAAGARRLRVRVSGEKGDDGWRLYEAEGDAWRDLGTGAPASARRPLELGVGFARLGVVPGEKLELAFRILRGEVALARYPQDGALALTVPDASFEAENWSA
ncbi:MAG TPA: glycoside hydrolase [Polyangia bacterium]|nr:glycoside hydrolase [Polyangia bacterium]